MQNAIRPLYSQDITRSGQHHRFLWHQYSERCAAIAALNFETVYYFAFSQKNDAQAFAQRIAGRHCNDVAVRASKRFTQGQYDWEVIPFFFIGVTTNAGLASIRAWMSVMDLEIWYKGLGDARGGIPRLRPSRSLC